MATTVVHVADLHTGSKFGLWNPDSPLAEGGKLILNKYQAYLWECWMYSAQVWLPSVCGKLDMILVVDGDAVDGTKAWAALNDDDETSQFRAASSALKILVPSPRATYMAAGTEAHVGKSQKWDNVVGELIGAIPDDTGRFAQQRLFLSVDGVTMDIAHHLGASNVPSSRMTPLMKDYTAAAMACYENGWPHTNWIIRAHRHYYRFMPQKGATMVSLPGWQAASPYVQHNTRQPGHDIGLFVLICDDGKATPHAKLFEWPTPKVEVVTWDSKTNQSQDSVSKNGQLSSASRSGLFKKLVSGLRDKTSRTGKA